MTMTFEQFKASGYYVPNLFDALDVAPWDDRDALPAQLYAGGLYVERTESGGWMLVLGNQDFYEPRGGDEPSDSLAYRLYEFGVSEGVL